MSVKPYEKIYRFFFLSWVIFNIVFTPEETGYNSVSAKSEISQKQNINRKRPHTIFSQI